MSLPTTIIDGKGTLKEACVCNTINGLNTPDGLMVYTAPYTQYTPGVLKFIDATGSTEMAVDGTFGGTPDIIHNGTDTVVWTGSALSGTWTFDSTAQAQAGTKSVDATATVNGDEASFAKGSDLSFASYVAVSGYIYLTGYNASRNQVQLRFRDNGLDVGNFVDIGAYVDTGTLNAWQKFSIPKADLGIGGETVDEMIIKTVTSSGSPPDYYLDTMQVENTGGKQFLAEPTVGQIFEASRIRFQMVDALAATLTDGTMPALSYNKFLNENALTDGITLILRRNGVIIYQDTWNDLQDMMMTGIRFESSISDGTNTMLTLDTDLPTPALMKEKDDDRFSISFSDNLAGLISFKAILIGNIVVQ